MPSSSGGFAVFPFFFLPSAFGGVSWRSRMTIFFAVSHTRMFIYRPSLFAVKAPSHGQQRSSSLLVFKPYFWPPSPNLFVFLVDEDVSLQRRAPPPFCGLDLVFFRAFFLPIPRCPMSISSPMTRVSFLSFQLCYFLLPKDSLRLSRAAGTPRVCPPLFRLRPESSQCHTSVCLKCSRDRGLISSPVRLLIF